MAGLPIVSWERLIWMVIELYYFLYGEKQIIKQRIKILRVKGTKKALLLVPFLPYIINQKPKFFCSN
jgi:hypothetical protein